LDENDHIAFLCPPLGDLGVTYNVQLRLIRKLDMKFLFVLTELFFLHEKIIIWNQRFWKRWVSFGKFSCRMGISTNHFCTDR